MTDQPKVPQEWLSTLEQDERYSLFYKALRGGTVADRTNIANLLIELTTDVPLARLKQVIERYPGALPVDELRRHASFQEYVAVTRSRTHDWNGTPFTAKQYAYKVRMVERRLHPLEFWLAAIKGQL